MPTLAELRVYVKDIISDPIFGSSVINDRLNRAVTKIAGGVLSPLGEYLIPPLPDLFTIDTVETSTSAAYISMPATFQRSLQFASNSSGQEIEIYNSMIEFAEDYPLMDGSGSVKAVIEQGGNLYYQDIPTAAETLTLHFFRLPVDMSADDDVPDGIPSHLAKDLLVNSVCLETYQEPRNKDTDERIKWHTELFNRALRLLEMTIPYDTRSLFMGD